MKIDKGKRFVGESLHPRYREGFSNFAKEGV